MGVEVKSQGLKNLDVFVEVLCLKPFLVAALASLNSQLEMALNVTALVGDPRTVPEVQSLKMVLEDV